MKKPNKYLYLKTYDEDGSTAAYLELADHPHELVSGVVKKTIRIHNLIPDYDGPGIALDFNESGKAIGIEIIYSDDELYDDDPVD